MIVRSMAPKNIASRSPGKTAVTGRAAESDIESRPLGSRVYIENVTYSITRFDSRLVRRRHSPTPAGNRRVLHDVVDIA